MSRTSTQSALKAAPKVVPDRLPQQVLSVTPAQASQILGITTQTLEKWRKQGRGPRFLRVGEKHSRVLYRVCDLEKWLSEHLVKAGE